MPWLIGTRRTGANWSLFRFLRADGIGKDKRVGVCGIASRGRLRRGSKDDDAVGSCGLHRGHGVGGARRLGVHLPGSGQRGRPRHAQRRDWPICRRLNCST